LMALKETKVVNEGIWPKEVPSRYGDIIFRLVKVMPDRAKYELIDAETGKTWELGGRVYNTVNQLKASAEDTIKPQGGRQSSQFESVNEAKTYKKGDKLKIKLKNGKKFDVVFDSYSSNKGIAYGKIDGDRKPFSLDAVVSESVNENLNPEVSKAVSRFIKAMAKRYDYSEQDAVYAIMAALKQRDFDGLNEATEKDPIDTITMDVPLFIRVLEYAREDAQADMDLHDLAEKAIAGTKQQGLLQMDDYDMLVGELEQIGMEENMSLDDQAKAYFLAKVKSGEIDTLPENPKAAFLAQMTKDQMDHDKETLRRERGLEEKAAYIAETIKLGMMVNEELCEKGKRYIKARQAAGEKSSAYLSGRAVRVCKGQIEWPKKGKKKKTNESLVNEGQKINQNLDNLLNKIKKDFNIDND